MTESEAMGVGLEALSWLAESPARRCGLLAASGLSEADVARGARDPEFLGFVLDFILSDERAARAFASARDLQPGAAVLARARLPGGATPDWT